MFNNKQQEPSSQYFNSKQQNQFHCTLKSTGNSPIEANRVDTVVVSLNPNDLVAFLRLPLSATTQLIKNSICKSKVNSLSVQVFTSKEQTNTGPLNLNKFSGKVSNMALI